jgi:hypothetical protein
MAALAHLGVGLAAKRVRPAVPLAVLVLCAWTLDLVWAGFWLAGMEGMAEPARPAPWSHGLFMAAVWSSLAAAVAWWVRRDRSLAIFIGLLVASHWVVDFVTQPMTHAYPGSVGPPLLFEGSPTVGLGLYRTALGQNLGELGGLAVGAALYAAAVLKIRRERRAAASGNGTPSV